MFGKTISPRTLRHETQLYKFKEEISNSRRNPVFLEYFNNLSNFVDFLTFVDNFGLTSYQEGRVG